MNSSDNEIKMYGGWKEVQNIIFAVVVSRQGLYELNPLIDLNNFNEDVP